MAFFTDKGLTSVLYRTNSVRLRISVALPALHEVVENKQ